MPLPPLPENNTDRVWVDYTSASQKHSWCVRPAGSPTVTELSQFATVMSNLLRAIMLNVDSTSAARYQKAGTLFSLPLSLVGGIGENGLAGNSWQEDADAAQLSVTARSQLSGRDVSYIIFTAYNFGGSWPVVNRVQPGANTVLDEWRESLDDFLMGGGSLSIPAVAIDGGPLVIKPYTNFRKNGYFQTRQRG